jgi:protein O-mannosyl-transferase
MKQRLIIIAALVTAVFAAHFPALRAGLVWDDTALVLRDPLIRSWRLIPEGLQHFLFTDVTASNFYRPLQRLTYTAEYSGFAFKAFPYHFDNICLHALAVIALFFFALAFLELWGFGKTKALAVAAVACAIWALHPLHSGVVDYVSGRADSLAAIFGFGGLYFGIRALRGDARRVWSFYALAGVALLASALSKESGLIFGAIWIVLIALRGNRSAIVRAVGIIALIITVYLTLRSQAGPSDVPQLSPPAPLLVRPIIAARALAEYTGLLLLPVNLHMDRDVESHPWGLNNASMSANAWRELETLAGVLVLGGVLFWLGRARVREPAAFPLLIFAAIAYAPISGLFALNATMAEHWIYVPSAFLLLAATVQLSHFLRSHRTTHLALAVATCWLSLLALRTFARAGDWHDEHTFFQRTIAAGGDSARMLINLGVLEMNEGHLERANALLQQALAKEPEQPFAILNLAAVALKRNDFTVARDFLARVQHRPVTKARAEEMLTVMEFKQTGKVDLLRLRLASRTGTPSWAITRRYISTLNESGRTEAAVRELRTVLASEWYRAESWELMSEYLTQLGHGPEAAEMLAQAKQLDVHCAR